MLLNIHQANFVKCMCYAMTYSNRKSLEFTSCTLKFNNDATVVICYETGVIDIVDSETEIGESYSTHSKFNEAYGIIF